ncbi:MAG: hypothetical protein KDM91_08455, partial [Verrucomicrobiae bacterium]|nr:hypothetical protein [Verrucomicrobiae bacterium]
DDDSDSFFRVPQLLLRKGQTYSTDGVTPRGVIRGMTLKPAEETSGAGGRGLGQVITSDARIVVTLIGDGRSRELVILNTGNIVVAPPGNS